MSFLTVVEQDLQAVDQAALTAAKELVGYVDNVVVIDILPVLETALKTAIANLGQEAVAALLGNASSVPTPPTAAS